MESPRSLIYCLIFWTFFKVAISCSRSSGQWGEWESEGSCSASCGGGFQMLRRSCLGADSCSGPAVMKVKCNNEKCLTAYTKLAVAVGGNPYKLDDIEVIDLSNPRSSCHNLPNFPETDQFDRNVFGSLGFGETPLICGGSHNQSICHSLQRGSWKPASSMREVRFYSAVSRSPFPNDGSKFFVTGGYTYNKDPLSSSEVLTENGWQVSTPLPVPMSSHCMVLINSTWAMVIGGKHGSYRLASRKTFLFNGDTRIWSEGPALSQERFGHNCAMVKKDLNSQDKSAIVVGSYSTTIDATEVLDFGSSEWRRGPKIPYQYGISRTDLVEDPQGGVILVGGYNGLNYQNILFKLAHARSFWEEMPQKLKTRRHHHTSFFIPDQFANC